MALENRILLPPLIVLCLLTGACGGSGTGSDETPIHVVSRNGTDRRDRPVANFTFEQFKDNRITLRITNITDDAVSFTYVVEFRPLEVTPQMPPWSTEGAANDLARNQVVNKGIVAINPAPIDLGTFAIGIDNVRP